MFPRQLVRVVDAAEFHQCCVDCDIQVSCVHPVCDGVEKIFADGRDAHANRSVQPPEGGAALARCANCSRVSTDDELLYVDGDEWSDALDVRLFGVVKPSVDIVLFCRDASSILKACLMEAKLGGTLPESGKVRNPSRSDLLEKIEFSMRRLGNKIPVYDRAYLIAPMVTLDEQRSRVHRWNQENIFPVRMECKCARDALEAVGVNMESARVCKS